MKKTAPQIIKPIPDGIEWTDDKIYREIVAALYKRYDNVKLDKICYENPFSENVHGSFTFHDKAMNTLHDVYYKVTDNELKIEWNTAE